MNRVKMQVECKMKAGIFIFILQYFVIIKCSKPKSVNLALETVLEFNRKENSGDVTLIDQVQEFLDKVKKVISLNHSYRRNLDAGRLTFTDFLSNAFEILSSYDNDALEDVLNVIDDEIRKYHYKGCKFYEILENNDVRRFVAENLDSLKLKSINKIRKALKTGADALRKGNVSEKSKKLLGYINSLYPKDAEMKFLDVLKNLKAYSNKFRRSNLDLIKIVRDCVRTVIFDHYSDLNINARRDLNMKLDGIWNNYKDPLRISYSVWTNPATIATKPSLIATLGKLLTNANPDILKDKFLSNHVYAGDNYNSIQVDKPKKEATFIASDDLKSIDNHKAGKVKKNKKKLTPKNSDSSLEADISRINNEYHKKKTKMDLSRDKARSIKHDTERKRHRNHKKHKSSKPTEEKQRIHKPRKKKEYKSKTMIAYSDDEEPEGRQTTSRLNLATLWTEKMKTKMPKFKLHRAEPAYKYQSEVDDRRLMKNGRLKPRFEHQALSTENLRRKNAAGLINTPTSAEGMSIESSGFPKESLRKSGNSTEFPKENITDTLKKLELLEKELKYIKEKIKVTATTFDKLDYWISTADEVTRTADVSRTNEADTTFINNITTIASPKMTAITKVDTKAEMHFRSEVNVSIAPEINNVTSVNELEKVIPFDATINDSKVESKDPVIVLRANDDLTVNQHDVIHANDSMRETISQSQATAVVNNVTEVEVTSSKAIISTALVSTSDSTTPDMGFEADDTLDFL